MKILMTVEFDDSDEMQKFLAWKKTQDSINKVKQHGVDALEKSGDMTPIEDSGLPPKAVKALKAERIYFLEHALSLNDYDLLKTPNFSRVHLQMLRGTES